MKQTNQQIIDRYFEAFQKHDRKGIEEVMDKDVKWYFMGRHPFAGVKRGIDEVIAFFDSMAAVMAKSKPKIEKPIVSENENYVIECVHTVTNSDDGINIDHFASVLWTFKDGKIIEGKHFFADPEKVDKYFTAVAGRKEG